VKAPVIEHGAFTLRLPAASDVPWIFAACQDEDIQRFTSVPSPYTPADAVGWITRAAEQCAAGREFHFLISLTDTGELLGSSGVLLSDAPGRGELGYWVDRDARRRGVATGAIAALERWSAARLGVVETFLRIAEANMASQAVAERCGYEVVGRDPEPCKGLPVLLFAKRLDGLQPADD
jgi:RimJ/RimL family protein N-acetyltransferase